MKSFGIIYKITNTINGKVYIGQTTASLRKRFSGHKWKGSTSRISKAIKKYGGSNFTAEVVCRCDSLSDLNNREISVIKAYNSLIPHGYNVHLGGNSHKRITGPMLGRNHSEATKKKMSISATGVKKSKEHCIRIGLAKKGTKWSEESKLKLSKTRTGVKKKGRSVYCVELNRYFISVSEFCDITNIPRRTACRHLALNKKIKNKYTLTNVEGNNE